MGVYNLAFPNIEPILRPEMKDRKIKSLHWLAGFTDAEGCFFVALKKSPGSKLLFFKKKKVCRRLGETV